MNISLRAVRIHRTPELDASIEKKVQTLEKYIQHIKNAVVEITGDTHHKKGDVIRVEIMLNLLQTGSKLLRVEEVASDVHEALDKAIATMKKNITAFKGKKLSLKKNLVRAVRGKE